MPDDGELAGAGASGSSASQHVTVKAATTSSAHSQPVPGIRRAMTIDESSLRRRPSMNRSSSNPRAGAVPRRSSNYSDYSLSEARDILNPQAHGLDDSISAPETSSLASLSLAFALLPAIAGSLFKNGSAVITDVMLLGLAGVFLHWSVTQPWSWYHSAQEVRVRQQSTTEAVIEEDSDLESAPADSELGSTLDDVPEEVDTSRAKGKGKGNAGAKGPFKSPPVADQRQTAIRELYIHEVLALLSCVVLPLISAYLLHAIRSQLSRPSEGLVSNYNLSIFLLVSELRAFSHMIKLVQSRTLHLQRVVNANPYTSEDRGRKEQDLEEVLNRLERLESSTTATEQALVAQKGQSSSSPADPGKAKQEEGIAREVRNGIQPELDALRRAVRRYEKKATTLQIQTESRFASLDTRLEDAIALAAAAARHSSHKNIFVWAVESAIFLLLLPFNAIIHMVLLVSNGVLALVSGKKQQQQKSATSSRSSRTGRTGKSPGPTRYSGDRVPSRVAKR